MVGPAAHREAVQHLVSAHGFSVRRSCRLIAICRASFHYRPSTSRNLELSKRLLELAELRPRFEAFSGYPDGGTSVAPDFTCLFAAKVGR